MSAKLYAHIRGNVVGYIALFFALSTGSAVALNGTNTVFTDDIVNDQVYSLDVRNDTLGGGGLAAVDLRPNSVGQSEVANGSLGTGEFASSIPAARVTRSTAQSVANATTVFLSFDTERYDTASIHDNVTNNSRLTAPVTGIYALSASILWEANATGNRLLHLRKNGTTDLVFEADPAATVADGETVTTVVRLAAGDYVQAGVSQDSGGSVNIPKSDEYTPEFSMTWLAPGP